MSLNARQLVRISHEIRDQLQEYRRACQAQIASRMIGLLGVMAILQRADRRLSCSLRRRWTAAAKRVISAMDVGLFELPIQIENVKRGMQECRAQIPSLREIYDELAAAQDEFGDLTCDKESHRLCVTIEPVTLGGIHLGEFEIVLHIPHIADTGSEEAYRVVALDPHTAATNESVTHPHVSDERMCPGNAGAAIQEALKTGRICDFFMLVRSVLTHYNPNSPFVSLDEWDGVKCYECGYTMDSDHAHGCEFCEESFCDECYSWCSQCEDSICVRCLEKCPVCEESMCPSCLTHCPHCEKRQCRECVDNEMCPCHEEEPEDVEPEEEAANQVETQSGRPEVVTASQAGESA